MVRTWVRSLGVAIVTAAFAAAGQFGIAYGLGVLRWDQDFRAETAHLWSAHLTFAAFIAALSVVCGSMAGRQALRRRTRIGRGERSRPDAPDAPGAPDGRGTSGGLGAHILLSLPALVGAAVAIPLVALPARATRVVEPLDPALSAGLAAGLGLAAGFFVALAALAARTAAGSVLITAIGSWILAIASAIGQLTGSHTAIGHRPGVLDLPALDPGLRQGLVLPVMVGLAVLAGAAIAGYARWLGQRGFAVAASGFAGPALVAAAYLIGGPGASAEQQRPWLAALLAAPAGLVASVLVSVARRRRPRTVIPDAINSGAVETDAIDSGGIDSRGIDSRGIDSGGIDTDPVDASVIGKDTTRTRATDTIVSSMEATGTGATGTDATGTGATGTGATGTGATGTGATTKVQAPARKRSTRSKAETASAKPDTAGGKPRIAGSKAAPTSGEPDTAGSVSRSPEPVPAEEPAPVPSSRRSNRPKRTERTELTSREKDHVDWVSALVRDAREDRGDLSRDDRSRDDRSRDDLGRGNEETAG